MNPKFSIDLPKVKLLNGHLLTLCMYMSLLHVSYTGVFERKVFELYEVFC